MSVFNLRINIALTHIRVKFAMVKLYAFVWVENI